MVLKLVDCIQIAFDVLIGMTPVQYTPAGGAVVNDALLPVLFQQPAIRTVFLQVTLLGLGIAGLLAIYAVVRSTFDFEMENRRPVGQVLQSCFKTALNFLLVPLFAYVMISLSGVILETMNEALDTETHTLGSTIFLVSSLEAAKQSSYNTNPSLTDTLRLPYANGTKDYTDVDVVEADFALEKVDYIVGFGAAVFLLVILGVCLILFVQRIYEVIVLYICSPLFVSVMPLDEGEKFSKWREMFVAKIFTGFGAAIGCASI
jgi:hypothetical protein